MAGAWNKLFGDRKLVTGAYAVKGKDGITRTTRPVLGPTGTSAAAFAAAVAEGGATLTETAKETTPTGESATVRRSIKADDISPTQAAAAFRDVVGLEEVPEPTRRRGQSVPLNNGAAADGATK